MQPGPFDLYLTTIRIDFGFSFLEPSSISWRFPIAFQIILALIIVTAIPGLPESPRWLILKGRNEEALECLSALANLPSDDPLVQDEFKAVNETVIEMSKGGFRDCFKKNKNRNLHRTILAYVNQMFQQVSCGATNISTSILTKAPRFLASIF